MPPKQKGQLDKGAWSWAETTDYTQVGEEHVRKAYRLNLAPCEPGSCKRNCKGNPFCLHSLGEKKWFGTVDETKWQNFDPEGESRQDGHFVGLKNLGATCYVNTFLQLWFHNPSVRRAVYQWRDPHAAHVYYEGWKPESICGHLQVIFALLQFSKRRYVDPSHLIECLGLDAGEQQDAQEFSKLFLHVLESALSEGMQGGENVIEQQFCGRYCYVTICQNCGSQSETPAMFYELDLNIRGHSTLAASIKDFLQEEKLEGDNQYMCSSCNSKQNATRTIKLKKLPPVLNLQLLRFVFDKNKGHKKKLSSFIQFPETLDMSPCFGEKGEGVLYELSAVLIHRGPTAYSGHYIAHIREPESGAWYKYNDEEIEKMNNRKLELGKEEDALSVEGSAEKAPKASKGNHSSRNAYMLVYRRREGIDAGESGSAEAVSEDILPAVCRGYVENDNREFQRWITEMLHTQDQNINEVKLTHEEMKFLYCALPVKTLDESWEWVSTDWLTSWLADPSKIDKVENKISRCPHDKLPADDVVKMKCISGEGAELLFTKYPVNHRYKGELFLCDKCIRQRCREVRFRLCMADDDKLFTSARNISAFEPGETYFWVSTKHLRSWKKFAMEEISAAPVSASPLKPQPPGSSRNNSILTSVTSSSSPLYLNSNHLMVPSDKELSNSLDTNNPATIQTCSISSTSFHSSRPSASLQPSSSLSLLLPSSSSPSSSSSSSSSPLLLLTATSPGSGSQHNHSNNNIPKADLPQAMAPHDGVHHQTCQNNCGSSSSSMSLDTCSTNRSLCSLAGEKDSNAKNTQSTTVEFCESPDSGVIVLKKTMDHFTDTTFDAVTEQRNSLGQFSNSSEPTDITSLSKNTREKFCNGTVLDKGDQSSQTGEMQGNSDDEEEKFNDDILCEHGNLRIDESGRRAVPQTIWERLVYYFPHLKPFSMEASICEQCLTHQYLEQERRQSRRQAGQGQKDVLQNLYHGKNRPKIGDDWQGRTACVVSSSFVEEWRKFVKHSVRTECVQEIVNAPLLCEHNLMLYNPEHMNEADSSTRFVLVWDEEWLKLTGYFNFDVEVQVLQLREDNGRFSLVTCPEICDTCLKERIRQEEEGKFIFTRQPIYVRKIVHGSGLDRSKGEDSLGNGKGKGYNYDPEFNAPPHQRLGRGCGQEPPPEKQARLDPGGLRKSSRHRRTRGEKEVVVSSNMTLKDLKIQLYNHCGVAPFDQNLSLDGRSLKDAELTLQELRVYPQCVIFLKADEPMGVAGTTVDDYLSVPTGPEEGFKGTNLLGR